MRIHAALALASLAAWLLFCGCAADPVHPGPDPDPRPGADTAGPGSEQREDVLPVSFVSLRVRAERSSEEGALLPGSSTGLEIGMRNAGPNLVDYPSVALSCSTPGIQIAEPTQILYGILAGTDDATLLFWEVRVDGDVAPGTEVHLDVAAFAHNSDQRAGRPAVGRGSFVLTVGQAPGDGE